MFATDVLGISLAGSTWHVVLTFVGAAAEIIGLSLIVWDAGRARRVEFGVLSWPRRFVKWVAAGTRRAHVSHSAELSGTASATASASGTLTIASAESQINRIERQLRELGGRVDRLEDDTQRRHDLMRRELRSATAELSERLVDYSDEQRELRRGALRLEVVGARLFIAGAVFSAAANLVA